MAYQVASGKRNCGQESGSNCDPEIKTLTDKYDFYFQPSVNPDGYVFSHESVGVKVLSLTTFWPLTVSRIGSGGKRDQVPMSIHGVYFVKELIRIETTMPNGVGKDPVVIRARKHMQGKHRTQNQK